MTGSMQCLALALGDIFLHRVTLISCKQVIGGEGRETHLAVHMPRGGPLRCSEPDVSLSSESRLLATSL